MKQSVAVLLMTSAVLCIPDAAFAFVKSRPGQALSWSAMADAPKTMQWSVNGKLVTAQDPAIAPSDAGLQHGIGLFETMHVQNGKAFRLDDHLSRLATSAIELGLVRELDPEPFAELVGKTLAEQSIDRCRLRLTLTAGAIGLHGPQDNGAPTPPPPTVIIQPTEPTAYDPAYFTDGIAVLVAQPAANPFDATAGHKTLNYWQRLRTLRQAASAGAGEAIWLNVTNHLASGAISNIFLVKDDALHTPIARGEEHAGALPAPVLPGVTRKAIIEISESQDIPVHCRMLSVDDLLGADEVFLTNSGWQVLPVSRVEKHIVGQGQAGPITTKLREALLEQIESTCADDGKPA